MSLVFTFFFLLITIYINNILNHLSFSLWVFGKREGQSQTSLPCPKYFTDI